VEIIELGYQIDSNNDSKGKLCSFSIITTEGQQILSASKGFDNELGGNINYKIDVNYFIRNLDTDVLNTNIKKELYDDPNERWGQKYWLNPNDELVRGRADSHESKVYFDALDHLKYSGLIKQTGWTHDEMEYFNQSIVSGLGNLGNEVMQWLELNFKHKEADFKRSEFGEFFAEDFSKYILNETIRYIYSNFDSIIHFSSIRSDSKKYYNENDKNLLSFFIEYEKEFKNFNSEINGFLQSQLSAFSIGDAIEVVPYKNFIAEVFVVRGDKKILLSDLGYGYTQLLPIIMRIALTAHIGETDDSAFLPLFGDERSEPVYRINLFLLEEPESNLHPSFQTRIADLIVEANKKFNIRFIVETHSEYLIRKLQYLTAIGKLKSSDTSILYFNKKGTIENEASPYRSIKIMESGRLSMPFGEGFFDEADKIAYELYRLKLNNN
jgi:hypothetical protein